MMKENMDKLEEESNEYVERRSKKKKKRQKKNEEEVKELWENNLGHDTVSNSSRKKKKNKESELEKVNGEFSESGNSNNSETLEKESMMQSSNGKKKKKNQKESELNEVEEGKKFTRLENESRIETSNGKKNKKKKKESELEKVHKELVEHEDSKNIETLEKERIIKCNNDKKKKKNKKKVNASEDSNKEFTNSEECKKNNRCTRISNLEGDTLIEPENNDKIEKKRNKQDLELTENKVCESEVIFDTVGNERNNKNKKKNIESNKESTIDNELRSSSKQSIDREVVDKKRKKKDKKKLDDEVSHLGKKIESPVKNKKKNKLPHLDEDLESSSAKKKRKMMGDIEGVESSISGEKKRKIGDGSEGGSGNRKKSNKENNDMEEKDAFKAKNKKINDESPHSNARRVRFSSNVEVFPMNEGDSTEKIYYEKNGDDSDKSIYNEKNNFAGKRFSPYEDQLIRDAAQKYIAVHQLGEDGIASIIHCRNSRLSGCWKEISKDLPWRNTSQIYNRGRLLLQTSEFGANRGFSKEELKKIMDFHAQNGPKWNELANDLKKNRQHIKDAYRRKRLQLTLKKGRWSQDEYKKLFELVHQNICAKIYEKRKNRHPMIRNDIAWEAISEKLKTRVMASCCDKWYSSLASPLVREEKWSDADDYRLLDALYYQEGCCEEDVDWDNLVETRMGEYCQKRWEEMVRNIGEYKERSFRDQINFLKARYDINMLKYVEALENKKREEESDDEEECGDEEEE